jgi:hypothetical protein
MSASRLHIWVKGRANRTSPDHTQPQTMPSYHSELQEGLLELCPFGEPHFHGKRT